MGNAGPHGILVVKAVQITNRSTERPSVRGGEVQHEKRKTATVPPKLQVENPFQEFDIQQQVLMRTREKLEAMEVRLAALEAEQAAND